MTIFTLRNIVNVTVLQEIQERFSEATGFAVIIADELGIPVTKPSNFTSFCTNIRSSEQGSKCCILSDRKVGQLAAQHGKPIVHHCHAGLVDIAAPLVLDGRHLGSVLCGQVLVDGHDEQRIEHIRDNFKQLLIDQDFLQKYFDEIKFVSKRRIEAAAEMLQLVANYIIEIGANHMAEQELNERNLKLAQEQQLRTQLEKLLQETQLKVLQSQINPHFLFNTLNTISRLAYLENAEQTQNVTYSLAKIMRYSLRNNDQMVTLKEELDYIQNYVNIQQSRFRNRIHYHENIEVNAEEIRIPIFTIQPIIENAIIHGFESHENDIVITLHCFLKDHQVQIDIYDTGIGMSEETLASLFSRQGRERNSHTTGIGMNNVQKRLQYYFGEDNGITGVESKIGAGTIVRISIPHPGGVII
ncbi:sensor histidine kinase [Fictibacillus terranigra]|uniref:histidine kinase n=1 Tax=Fictibacillus terranigra TaxID=3058424 RepID=A0ABT8E535_9BACL|nr:PocR ligand-binding domain-containing protein [Fictibacillus sp. CENA-BCM004]MDN4073010.1 PocR ligand-binding domain-containing protein [Fictibacillus sp. CENA-BCM004]